MKRVAGFVQHRLHIALQPDRIHENERQARLAEGGLITAGRFAFAIRQIEQMPLSASFETRSPGVIQSIKDALRFVDHSIDLLEGLQRRTIQRIDRQIPRPERGTFSISRRRAWSWRTTGMTSFSIAS